MRKNFSVGLHVKGSGKNSGKGLPRLRDSLLALEGNPDPGPRHFAKMVRWEIDFFGKLTKVARQKGAEGVRSLLMNEDSPFQVGGVDVYGGGEDRWYFYLWATLFPEKFTLNQKGLMGDPGFLLKEGENIGEREKSVILGLLTSPYGRALILDAVIERIRGQYGNQPRWPDGMENIRNVMESLIGSLSVCASPACGDFFLGDRKGQRFCSEACRKRANAVPSTERKDPMTARIYFWRKVDEGYSREDAWKATLARHGTKIKESGLDGPQPPESWAKPKGEQHGTQGRKR